MIGFNPAYSPMRNHYHKAKCVECGQVVAHRRRRDFRGSGFGWYAVKHKTTQTREGFFKGKIECPGSGKAERVS